MSAVVRTWLGFAALGAGLIHLALAVDAPVALAVVLVVFGLAEFGWGILAFTTDAIPLPQAARVATLVPVVLWALALVSGLAFAGAVRVFPMLAASVLDLAIAIGVSLVLRRSADATAAEPRRPARALSAPAYLAAMAAGALVVGIVTTPALAATEAGDVAVQHGDVGGHTGHP